VKKQYFKPVVRKTGLTLQAVTAIAPVTGAKPA